MTPVVCGDCKKRYDYEVDDFCPRCGAYNRPDQRSTARRVDGVNETGHAGSFVHSEVHHEKEVRRRFGLDRPKSAPPRQAASVRQSPPFRQSPPAGQPQFPRSGQSFQQNRQSQRKNTSAGAVIGVFIWIIVMLQFLRFCAYM